MPSALSRVLRPRAVFFALTALAFLIALAVPYRIDTDTGFQLRSVEQWLRGESLSPATLRLPDPGDLSRDREVWSTWWPPGFPFAYTPLAGSGLSLAAALRATSFLLFLLGGLGWLRLADRLELPGTVRALYAVALASYALTVGGAATLRGADVLSFAAAPWLARLALALASRPGALRLLAGGLAFGGAYWLRYSLFLTAVTLAGFVAFRVLRQETAGWPRRIARLTALGLGFALPVAALFVLNLRLSADLKATVTGNRKAWKIDDSRSAEAPFLALSVAGAPGLGLFQADYWANHLVFFSDARLPLLRGRDRADRVAVKALLGIPGTLLLAWALARAWRRRPEPLLALAVTAVAGSYLALTAVSVFVHYNYLANEVRFAAGFLPLAYPFVLAEGLAAGGGRLARLAIRLGSAALFVLPLAFALAVFLQHDLRSRAALPYRAAGTGLFTPEIAAAGPAGVVSAVAGALSSPADVVVLAGPPDWGSSFLMWLEFPQRVLPVSTFYAPLGARYDTAGDLRATSPYTSSRPLRVVLVASRELAAAGWLPRLFARFPQASRWTSVPTPADANVALYFTDLAVP